MNFEEKTLSSECVYDGRIIKVCRDEIELSTGRKSFREVVHHSGGVVILAFKDENTLLFVKQFRYPLKQTLLELPAGKLEKVKSLTLPQNANLKKKPVTGLKTGSRLVIFYLCRLQH